MKIYLTIGLICLFSVNAFSWIAPIDDNHKPAAVVADPDGDFLDVNSGGAANVTSSSTTAPFANLLIWDGTKWVEAMTATSTDNNLRIAIAEATNTVKIAVLSVDDLGTGIYSLSTRSFLYGYDAVENKWHRLRADRILKTQKTISVIHSEVHDGHMFNASYVWETLADDATGVFLVDTSTKNVHVVFKTATGGNAQIKLWEGAVVTSSGTGLSEINYNRIFSDTPMAKIYRDPTQVNPTTLLYWDFVGGGAGVGAATTASGGAIRENTEWILTKNQLYVISVENESGGATFVAIAMEWYEEEID